MRLRVRFPDAFVTFVTLVAFRKDPIADVSVLAASPALVMKGGVVVVGATAGGR